MIIREAWSSPILSMVRSGTEAEDPCDDVVTDKTVSLGESTGGYLDDDGNFVSCGPTFQLEVVGGS